MSRDRHRCGHHGRPQPRRVRRRTARGRGVPGVRPALSGPRLGRARRDRDLDVAAETLSQVIDEVGRTNVAAIGITNQRETVLAWNRSTGAPYGTAIVWQDRRTAPRCDELTAAGHLPLIRERTGLVLDPYFSGTKAAWLLEHRDIPVDDDLAIGTIDAWLIWNLTGGRHFVTDVTNASRTMLCNIENCSWDPELCDLLGVPIGALPEIVPSSGRIGTTAPSAGFPTALRSVASPAISKRRCSGRPASAPEWPRTPTAPARSCCSTWARRARRPPTACSPPSRGSSPTAAPPTPSKGRSSSPAQPSSGSAMACRSSTTPQRPARSPSRLPTPVASTWCPRWPASAHRGGIRMHAGRSSASPAGPAAPRSHGPSSNRWPTRPATSSTR